MTAAEQIEQALATIKSERIEWLKEKPPVPQPKSDNIPDFLSALRDEYRWYRDQRASLMEARQALDAMIEDCDWSMRDTEQVAATATEADTKMRQAARHAEG